MPIYLLIWYIITYYLKTCNHTYSNKRKLCNLILTQPLKYLLWPLWSIWTHFLGMFEIGLCMYYFKRVLLHMNDNRNIAMCRQCCCRTEYNEPLCVMPKNTIINTKNQLCNVDCCWFGKLDEIMCFLLWKYYSSIAYYAI